MTTNGRTVKRPSQPLPVPTEEERTVYFPHTQDPDPVRTEYHLTDDNTLVINRVQELTKIRDHIRAVKNGGGHEKEAIGRLTHMIPNIWFERWMIEDYPVNPWRLRGKEWLAWVERHIQKDDTTDFRIDGNKSFHAFMGRKKYERPKPRPAIVKVSANDAARLEGRLRRVPERLTAARA